MENGTTTAQFAETITTAVKRPKGAVTRNPVLVALTKISTLIESLDDTGKVRVLRYLAEEYSEFIDAADIGA